MSMAIDGKTVIGTFGKEWLVSFYHTIRYMYVLKAVTLTRGESDFDFCGIKDC